MAFFSRVEYTGVTGTGPFSYSGVRLLTDVLVSEQSQLIVTVNGEELTFVAAGPAAGEYTLNKTTKNVTLGTALVTTDVLLIRRATARDVLHVVFTNNSPLNEDDMNLVLNQLLFIAQEAQELQEVQRTFGYSGMLQGYRNQDYVLDLKAPFTFDVSSFTTQTSAGTVTAKLQIDGVDATGSSHSASVSETTQSSLSNNRVLAGQTLKIVLSAASIEDTHHLFFSLTCSEV